jgi:hypothetical protein
MWSKQIPKKDGWYWCKYKHPTKGVIKSPAKVLWIDDYYTVTPALGPAFCTNTSHLNEGRFQFGPKIEEPF